MEVAVSFLDTSDFQAIVLKSVFHVLLVYWSCGLFILWSNLDVCVYAVYVCIYTVPLDLQYCKNTYRKGVISFERFRHILLMEMFDFSNKAEETI